MVLVKLNGTYGCQMIAGTTMEIDSGTTTSPKVKQLHRVIALSKKKGVHRIKIISGSVLKGIIRNLTGLPSQKATRKWFNHFFKRQRPSAADLTRDIMTAFFDDFFVQLSGPR
jgi:CRISPR/Cas system CSM-associated protein Csm3 (group 7 of RAMP superfamily)